MNAQEIEALLRAGLEDCQVSVSGEGGHFDILVVGEMFAGLRAVKKQQLVYAVLNERITDGSIHAVNIRTLTPGEYQEQS